MYFFPKAWVLPGGGIEVGESLEVAMYREVSEETGIDLRNSESRLVYAFESASYS